ncbi:hypothetical protein E2C01_032872 [Portunus trituberculatus]|uniref:Uncharacterized protein n=1 Tax=Portunus trituberculatus TaxID=210409 RepID=A0A5B7F281_PORTR|nr:hypothetical protein [Portunus trituberculatus]
MKKMCARAQEKQDKRISELLTSLEFTQPKLDEATANLKHISDDKTSYEKRIGILSKENDELRKQVQSYESRLDYLDDQSRRNNLRIVGIPEEAGENWENVRDGYRSESGGRDRHAGGGMVQQPSTPRTPPRTTTHPHPTTPHQGTLTTSRTTVTTPSTSSTVTTATPSLTWCALARASPGRGVGGSDEVGAMALPQRHRGSPAEMM